MDGQRERDGSRRDVARLTIGAALLVLVLTAALGPGDAGSASSSPLGHVSYIYHGLSVQPPQQAAAPGKLKESLYNAYLLATAAQQKATITFQDNSLLEINQLTAAVLRSASVTAVQHGEVEQQVTPGTNHQIVTASAVCSAVGTHYDVRATRLLTIVTVIEGAVLVRNARGSVVVTTGEQTRVRRGRRPTAPVPVDTSTLTAWTNALPPPAQPIGINIALAANGGTIGATTERAATGGGFAAGNAIDGHLGRGWQSASGATSNQTLVLQFQGTTPYPVTELILDCAATGGELNGNDLSDFALYVSDQPASAGQFRFALSGQCKQKIGLQTFALAAGTQASSAELLAKDNHGGADGIALAEIEIISPVQPAVLGTPTPGATATPIHTLEAAPTVPATSIPATATPLPTAAPSDTPTSVPPTPRPTLTPTATPSPPPTT
jgi:hypothetical protein